MQQRLFGLMAGFALLMLLVSGAFAQNPRPTEKYLYVWAGDATRTKPDVLVVINFDESAADYGKVIKTVPLPPPGNVGNEPHHVHLSADGNVLACGGLLSLVRGQDTLFFFDVSNPVDPKLMSTTRASLSSITDDFYALPGGGFLVTNMGSATGGTPGRVLELDGNQHVIKEWPENPPQDGFNPHGISVRPEINLMVTSDFLDPLSTLNPTSGPILRHSIRVWDLAKRTIVRSVQIPAAVGTMDVHLIPGDPKARAYTCGVFDNHVYLVDTVQGTAKSVIDFNTIRPGTTIPGPMPMPEIIEMTSDGKRLLFPLRGTGQMVMYDTSNPDVPVLLSTVDLGPNSGPHDIRLSHDEKRLVVTDYFLDEDNLGVVHFDGDHRVHVLKVEPNGFSLDTRFQVDLNTLPSGPVRPHGLDMK